MLGASGSICEQLENRQSEDLWQILKAKVRCLACSRYIAYSHEFLKGDGLILSELRNKDKSSLMSDRRVRTN